MSINKLENLMRTDNRQRTENREQTDREFNYRGHSYPLWIVGVSGPIFLKYLIKLSVFFMPTYIDNSVETTKEKCLDLILLLNIPTPHSVDI